MFYQLAGSQVRPEPGPHQAAGNVEAQQGEMKGTETGWRGPRTGTRRPQRPDRTTNGTRSLSRERLNKDWLINNCRTWRTNSFLLDFTLLSCFALKESPTFVATIIKSEWCFSCFDFSLIEYDEKLRDQSVKDDYQLKYQILADSQINSKCELADFYRTFNFTF